MLPILLTSTTTIQTAGLALSNPSNTNNQGTNQFFAAIFEKLGEVFKVVGVSVVNLPTLLTYIPGQELVQQDIQIANYINEQYALIKQFVDTNHRIDISVDTTLSSRYFPNEIENLTKIANNFNNIYDALKIEVDKLRGYERDGKLLTTFSGTQSGVAYGLIVWRGGTSSGDWDKYISPMLTSLENIGIIQSGWTRMGRKVYTDPLQITSTTYTGVGGLKPNNLSDWLKNLLSIYGGLLTVKPQLVSLEQKAIDKNNTDKKNRLVPLLSNNNVEVFNPSMNISGVVAFPPTTLPKPAFGQPTDWRLDEEDLKKLLATLIALFGIALALKLLSMLKLQTISVSATRTVNAEAPVKPKLKQDRRIPRKIKKRLPKTFKYAERNVGRHSEWIEKVSFEFPITKDYQSNDRGTLIFYLKNGRTIRRVRVARGTFSFIVYAITFVPYGVGYRFWSHFNRKYLVNPNTISIGLRMISNADRIKAIPKELSDKQVIYR